MQIAGMVVRNKVGVFKALNMYSAIELINALCMALSLPLWEGVFYCFLYIDNSYNMVVVVESLSEFLVQTNLDQILVCGNLFVRTQTE